MYPDNEPKHFRGITTFDSETNPRIMATRLAVEKRLDVGIYHGIDIQGNLNPNVAAINVHPKDEPLFRRILYSAEIMAFPIDYCVFSIPPLNEELYWWRVYDNYLYKARREWRSGNYIEAGQYDARAIGARVRIEMVKAGELSFLETTSLLKFTADMHELVERVVDRELASSHSTYQKKLFLGVSGLSYKV